MIFERSLDEYWQEHEHETLILNQSTVIANWLRELIDEATDKLDM